MLSPVFIFSEGGKNDGMSTVNIILMAVLCAMIGFAIGNVYGRESMKKTVATLFDSLTKGLKNASEQAKKKEE